MVKFSATFLDTLKAEVDLASLINRYVPLKKKGREYMACCPFHQEKTPSFTVNPQKGFYHCFGCGAHGSAFDFVMNVENLTFPEAVEKLAEHAGILVPRRETTPEEREQFSLAEEVLKIHEYAASAFENSLETSFGEPARSYLTKRGLTQETVKKFRLGFSLSSRDSLYKKLLSEGFSQKAIHASGLIIFPDEGGRDPYDKFRGRLMFPIFNIKKQVIAFGGRLLEAGEPKYLNSPETVIFKKGFELYNLAFAKESPARKDPWVIVEGYMDAIALFQHGYETVVAPLGTALTENHVKKLWRFCETPILCFDGDKAGKRASFRAADRILPSLKPGCSLSFAFLPEGHDPDSFVGEQGVGAFRSLIGNKTHSLVEVVWEDILSTNAFQTPEEKARVKQRILEVTNVIEDGTIKTLYRKDLEDRFFKLQRRPVVGKGVFPTRGQRPNRTSFLKEKILLALLIQCPPLLEHFEEKLVLLDLGDDALNSFKKTLLDYYYSGNPLEKTPMVNHLMGSSWSQLIEGLMDESILMHVPSLNSENMQEIIKDCEGLLATLEARQAESHDLRTAKDQLKESLDKETWKRFKELKKTFDKSD